ncbi:hypothetical protein [Polaribacter uvawellassae]
MANSEKILIAIILVYSLFALIKAEINESKISSLKNEIKRLKKKELHRL